MASHDSSARVLFNLSSTNIGTTLAATASSPRISVERVEDLWLAVSLGAAPTGTTPTLDVQIDVQDADGNWYPRVAKATQLTTSNTSSAVSLGLHIAAAQVVLPHWCCITWTLGGTASPTFTKVSLSLHGR